MTIFHYFKQYKTIILIINKSYKKSNLNYYLFNNYLFIYLY